MATAIDETQASALLALLRENLPDGADMLDTLGELRKAAAEEPLAEELTITLRTPLTVGPVSYPEMTLREPTAAQMQTWDKLDNTEADIKAVSQVSGIPEAAVRMMGARDLRRATRYISRFFD